MALEGSSHSPLRGADADRSRGPVQMHELGLSEAPRLDEPGQDSESNEWVLSYADMVTLLLLFFVMMFSVSEVNQEAMEEVKEALRTGKSALTKSLASKRELEFMERATKDEIGGVSVHKLLVDAKEGNPTEQAQIQRTVETLMSQARASLDSEALERSKKLMSLQKSFLLEAEHHGLREEEPVFTYEVSFPADRIFQGDTFLLSRQGEALMRSLAERLTRPQRPVLEAEVEAYDDRPIPPFGRPVVSSAEDYTALRASRVAKALEGFGVPSKSLKFSGMGRGHALAPEGVSRNRRILFRIRKFAQPQKGTE